ncbi:MAG: hypothetical protein ACYCWW_18495 [Deltaproteobacteria bacterium]
MNRRGTRGARKAGARPAAPRAARALIAAAAALAASACCPPARLHQEPGGTSGGGSSGGASGGSSGGTTGSAPDGGCLPLGGLCSRGADCCQGDCNRSICDRPGCASAGDDCIHDSDCCLGGGAPYCYLGDCSSISCGGPADVCSVSSDCCEGFFCQGDQCGPERCRGSQDCAGNAVHWSCEGGLCVPPPPPAQDLAACFAQIGCQEPLSCAPVSGAYWPSANACLEPCQSSAGCLSPLETCTPGLSGDDLCFPAVCADGGDPAALFAPCDSRDAGDGECLPYEIPCDSPGCDAGVVGFCIAPAGQPPNGACDPAGQIGPPCPAGQSCGPALCDPVALAFCNFGECQ